MDSEKIDEKAAFNVARQITQPDAREAYLHQVCGGNIELVSRVHALLQAYEGQESFLESPATDPFPTIDQPVTEKVGETIGPYKLLQKIGEGGMGVVYMAEQVEPIERRVALKIIKPGMDTRQVIARFEAERQALAMMDHPNISKIYEAGVTETGRSYFVMELVKGVTITEYCDEQRLSPRERLELFVPVCQAIQHAHQKGIIHRDIKPSNVLVAHYDDWPVPKIIDFGVAKAIDHRLTEKTIFTEYGQVLGTLEYMSPEQARFNQWDVDTRSDVYSLGVLLYELLSGEVPFDRDRLRSAAFDELLRIIREEEPPRPSLRLSTSKSLSSIAANRHTEPEKLSTLVRGELDWIVMKALDKDRTRRYETANGLARDVERYLNNEPVEACPPSRTYRLRKIVLRNKGAFLTASLVAAALIAAATVSIRQATIARRAEALAESRLESEMAAREEAQQAERHATAEAARSEQVAHFLKDMLAAAGPSVARGRDATVLKEVLARTAERVEKDLIGQPEVQGDLWYSLGSTYQDIGDRTSAVSMLKKAIECYCSYPGNPSAKLARALGRLGYNQSYLENVSDGKANGQSGLEMARRIGDKRTLSDCLYYRARACTYWGMGTTEAIPLLEECLALRRELGGDPIGVASAMHSLSICDLNLPEAESLARGAHETFLQHLGEDHPRTLGAIWALAQIVLKKGRAAEAEALLRKTRDKWQHIYGEGHTVYGIVTRMLAASLAVRDKWGEAFKLLTDLPSDKSFEAEERLTYHKVISLHLTHGRHDQARAVVDKMYKRLDEHVKKGSNDSQIARYQWDLVRLYARLGDAENATKMRSDFAANYEISDQAKESFNAKRSNDIARKMIADGVHGWDPELAVQVANRAVKLQPTSGDYWNTLGVAHYRAGDYHAAVEALERANQFQKQGYQFDGFFLAMAHQQLGHDEEARRWYDRLVDWMDEELLDNSELRRFRTEASELLGIVEPESAESERGENETESVSEVAEADH